MNSFRTARDEHCANYVDHDAVKIEMPWKEEYNWVEYKDEKNQFRVLFTMYPEFESLLKPLKQRSKVKNIQKKLWWLILKMY